MIRLDRIELLHWDIQPHQMLPLSPGVNLLTGENGAGKTSILDAIKVVLGAPRLEGERSVNSYLLKQAKGVAMIRLLLDNRAEPGTRRRPLDTLGEYGKDVVTLAVVFRAEDEKEYRREYYVLDGDRSPLTLGTKPGTRPAQALESAAAYRERLHKVGLGNRYLKLLCLPQGQIASLCRHDGAKLFEYLFDIIGGQEVKATWTERLRELGEARRSHEEAKQALEHARSQLVLLSARAKRFEEFIGVEQDLASIDQALPHARRRDLLIRRERLQKDIDGLERTLDAFYGQIEAADHKAEEARTALAGLKDQQALLVREIADKRRAKDEHFGLYREQKLQVAQLEALRDKVAAVSPADPTALRQEADQARQRLAEGQGTSRRRAVQLAGLEQALGQIAKGLLPYPVEVEALRDQLRQAGVPHHLLAEVVDINEEEPFRPAIEAYLGRLRFAILVQDPDSFTEAARIARAARYPHGVLAPDVRGSSPADEQGLLPLLSIKEPRYQPLLARILRRVLPGEPPPGLVEGGTGRLVPPRHGEHLARDGFVLSRIEARVDSTEHAFLGRSALQQRREELVAQRDVLLREEEDWRQAESDLRMKIGELELAITLQTRRLEWEAARPEHQRLLRERDVAAAEVSKLQSDIEGREARQATCQSEAERLNHVLGDAENQLKTVGKNRTDTEELVQQRHEDLNVIETDLASYPSESLPMLGPHAKELLADDPAPRTLESMQKDRRARLADFRPEERDPLLPTNHTRQRSEVDAVTARLEQIEGERQATQVAAEEAQEQYQQFTRRVFRHYFARLRDAGASLDFAVDGKLAPLPTGDFACDVRVGVGQKAPVHYRSEDLSGGQKAALSILMGMTAVSLESDGPGFFLIDEPFSQSDLNKINELGWFLQRTGSQYMVSMPTSADVEQCGGWLSATWICTKTRGGVDERGRPVLAPPVKLALATGARDG